MLCALPYSTTSLTGFGSSSVILEIMSLQFFQENWFWEDVTANLVCLVSPLDHLHFSQRVQLDVLFFSEQWRLDSNFPGKFFTSCISLWQFSNQKLTYNYHLVCPIPRCAFKIYTRKNFDMVSLEFILICLRAIRVSSSIVRQIEV